MKKYKKILLIITIIVVLGLSIVGILTIKKEKALYEVTTYYGEQIENYDTNKNAFIIEKKDDNIEIKVNGQEYKNNQGFYKEGTYEIKVTSEGKTEKKTIKINPIEKQNEYNIFLVKETLPILLSSFNMVKEKNIPSYIYYDRSDTLNTDNIKEMFTDVTISEYIGKPDINNTQFSEKIIPEVREFIKDKLSKDENAYFNIYVTAEYYWMGIIAVEGLGLSDERVNTTMYSCGTNDYVNSYMETGDNVYEEFLKEKDNFNNILDKIKSNLYNDEDYTYLSTGKGQELRLYLALLNASRDNVVYYLQYPELLPITDTKIKEEINNANIEKIVIREQFNKLAEEQKQDLYKCIGINKQEFDEKYFNSQDKDYLIITGTKPYYGGYSQEEFENIINQIVNKYGQQYKILYKPHPMALPDTNQEKYLNDLNIEVLPGRMPIEAITFMYDNLKLGGFASSLYMNIDKGNTLFFICKSKDILVTPLDILYDDLFADADFIQPNT